MLPYRPPATFQRDGLSFRLATDGSAAQAATYDQWLEDQCDLGLLVVDIDDYLDEILDE